MVVYWCDVKDDQLIPHVKEFEASPTQITALLNFCAELRQASMLCITSTGEGFADSAIVKDGKLPNGQPYTWKKRRI